LCPLPPALLCCLSLLLNSGLLCTDAILSSISEEKAVVQLAQELVKHEAVVAEASRAQQKAKEAAAAVDAVSTAAQQLSNVTSNTNNTLGALTAAAEALNTIAVKNGSGNAAGDSHSMWDLKGR
jgi:sodium-coupled neutral amino acid transporter 10